MNRHDGTKALFRLAWQHVVRHPWRSSATVLGVAVGIAAVLATLSVGSTVRANLQAEFASSVGRATWLIAPGTSGRSVFPSRPVIDALRDVEAVAALRPVLSVAMEPIRDIESYVPATLPGVNAGFLVFGRDLGDMDTVPAALRDGRWPMPRSRDVALSTSFARARGLSVGDEVVFATRFGPQPFTVVGLLEPRVGVAANNGGRVALTSLDVLEDAARLTGRVSWVEVEAASGVSRDELERALREALGSSLGETLSLTLPAGPGTVAGGIIDTLQAGLLVLAATLLALGGFLAYNTFMAGVVERTRTYATLRTVALRRREVARIALFEGVIIAGLGTVSGLILGIGMSWLLAWMNAVGLGLPMRTVSLPVGAFFVAAAVGASVAVLASVLPARVASRAAPLVARRDADVTATPSSIVGGMVTLVLALVVSQLSWSGWITIPMAALVMTASVIGIALVSRPLLQGAVAVFRPVLHLLFGPAGRLAAAFTLRSANRNGVAMGTVVVGTALVIGVGSMVAGINGSIEDWIEASIVGDLFVTSPVAFDDTFKLGLTAVEGVDDVSGVAIRAVRFEPEGDVAARSVAMVLVDPERFHPTRGFGSFPYVEGQGDNTVGFETLAARDAVIISSALQERFGLAIGDTVSLRTRDGFEDFRVGAVVVDYTGGGESVLTTIRELDRFGGGSIDLYVLTVDPAADRVVVADRVREAFPEMFLDVTEGTAYREEILAVSRRTFTTTNVLLVLAVVIAALGVANTLGMNLASRQRDVATLRVTGLSRAGVQRVVLAEGLVVVGTGTLLGVAFGLLLGDLVTAGATALTGYLLEPSVPWTLVVIALASSPLVGLLASFVPARVASRQPPVVALRGTS